MKTIYQIRKCIFILIALSLIITGCKKTEDAKTNPETNPAIEKAEESAASQKEKTSNEESEKESDADSATGESEKLSDDDSEEVSDKISDEGTDKEQALDEADEKYQDSIYSDHTDMKFGKFTINGFFENNEMVTFEVEEKVIVTPKDRELIKKYGLPEDLNGYDYEIVDLGDPEIICAFKWECTCIMFDYGKMEASRVDWDTFGNHMFNMDNSHYDEESGETILEDGALRSIWAYYAVDEEGFMTSIEEVYIP